MNAAFFEVTKDSTTTRVHNARRKALAGVAAHPEYDFFGIKAYPTDVIATHRSAGTFGLFSGMSHGSSDEFESQLSSNQYDTKNSSGANHTTNGAIVHLYSCDCGKTLGPYLVRTGKAKAFIGYVGPVSVPSTQTLADEFVKVAAAIDRSILNGDISAVTKAKAEVEFAATDARLRAPTSTATPRDVANFRVNHRRMVGPWTNAVYGAY